VSDTAPIQSTTMTAAEFDALLDIESCLSYATDIDHFCDENDCGPESPKCRDMHAIAALKRLRSVLEPSHEGLHPKQLGSDAERIYAERWKKENERHNWINDGFTLIEHILCPEDQRLPDRVSIRDAQVAAAVVQWLGTACGNCFVRQCENQIESARVERRAWSEFVNYNRPADPEDLRRAKLLAGRFASHPAHDTAVNEIAAALKQERESGAKAKIAELQAAIAGLNPTDQR